jgi:hypothetical protein
LSIVLDITAIAGHIWLDIFRTVTADCAQVARGIGRVDCMKKTGRWESECDAGKKGEQQGQKCGLHCEEFVVNREMSKVLLVKVLGWDLLEPKNYRSWAQEIVKKE